jgi:hypothetical protein
VKLREDIKPAEVSSAKVINEAVENEFLTRW